MSIIYDGDFTTASRMDAGTWAAPFPGVKDKLIFTQTWCQLEANYSAATIGSVYPDITDAPADREDLYLCEESDLQPMGAGLVRWTRTYAKVPADRVEWEWRPYTFPGYMGLYGINVEGIQGRERFSKAVLARVTHKYYLVGVAPYATIGDIPLPAAQKYYMGDDEDHITDYLCDAPISPVSTPSRANYAALVAADAFNLTIEDGWPERWLGNIYTVRTVEIKAQ